MKDSVWLLKKSENFVGYILKNYRKDMDIYPLKGRITGLMEFEIPYNRLNMFAMVLLEFDKATGNEEHREIVAEIFKKFSDSLIHQENKILWHYWPQYFYEGCSMEDNISVNTPERSAAVETLSEDLRHAGING
jgi:hypothetical protein